MVASATFFENHIILTNGLPVKAPDATTDAFCMLRLHTTLTCWTLGPILGAPGPSLGPGRPGPPFLNQNSEKHDFVEGTVPPQGLLDVLRGEWFAPYPGTCWVWSFPPKPSQGKVLQGTPVNPKAPKGPPGPLGCPWVGCLLSLCGLVAYTTPD